MRLRFTATNVLVAINLAAFAWEALTGGWSSPYSLVAHGALYGPAVDAGQWWRVITGAFLHGGLLHITFNMIALYQVGTFLEMLVGAPAMLSIYFISMVGSGIAVYHFGHDQPTVGASGAIFGIFGALVAIGLSIGPRGRSLVMQTLPIIGINLAIGFSLPNISNAAHIGGLISGFAAGFVLLGLRRAFIHTAPLTMAEAQAALAEQQAARPELEAESGAEREPEGT